MTARTLVCAAAAAVLVGCAAPAAHAATIAADPTASEVTALDGTVVWVSGPAGAQTLMRRDAAGTQPVQGAPTARFYRSIDLGHDRAGASSSATSGARRPARAPPGATTCAATALPSGASRSRAA